MNQISLFSLLGKDIERAVADSLAPALSSALENEIIEDRIYSIFPGVGIGVSSPLDRVVDTVHIYRNGFENVGEVPPG